MTPRRGRGRHRRGRGRGASPPPDPAPAGDEATCTLRLDRLAAGGDAIATRDDGKTVFVEDGAPGDVVRVRIVDERKRFARAVIDEVLEPSPDRIRPRCRHFGTCGGCAWQHLRYSAQVRAKSKILRDALERIGGLSLADDPEITASPLEYAYRGRARVHMRRGRVGFLERASHRLCVIAECPVLLPELEHAVAALADEPPGAAGRGDAAEDGEWSLCVGSEGEVSIARARARTASPPDRDAIPVSPVVLTVGDERIGLDAAAFSQANPSLHAVLVERVLGALFAGSDGATRRRATVLEVHAGVGFFTCSLAREVDRVVAVESDAHACEWLAKNVAALPPASATVEIVSESLATATPGLSGRHFDAVLLDPPRTGLASAELAALVDLAPHRVVYLSCDPATLARDARGFADAGYVLEHVEGFDLFPQTPHTEGLLVLVRR